MLTRKEVHTMINDIKLDGLKHLQTPNANTQKEAAPVTAAKDGITVSSHLSDMANTLLADDESIARKQRVDEIARQINQKSYRIDTDKLATTLAHGILSVK